MKFFEFYNCNFDENCDVVIFKNNKSILNFIYVNIKKLRYIFVNL